MSGQSLVDWAQTLLYILLLLGVLLSGALMVILFAAAFYVFWKTVPGFFQIPRGDPTLVDGLSPLVLALKGLEYLFLAPLPFLVFRSLTRYVRESKADGAPSEVEHGVHRTKSLIMGLMVAIIATDLVSRILEPQGLELKSTGAEVIVMVVLMFYALAVEHQHSRKTP